MPVLRFRPGLFYSRSHARGPSATCTRRGCAATGLQLQRPEQATADLEVQAAANTATAAAASEFVEGFSHPLPKPILQVPPRRASPPQRRKKTVAPVRRSVRIAARNWPRGDTQAKARQVLMKRLGILTMKDSATTICCCATSACSRGRSPSTSSRL